jgi:4-amino-4-deoxy-L-arabinose transferase-like glycosyltransferase
VLYVAAGLGLLTKGPEAVVFPAAAVLVAVALSGRPSPAEAGPATAREGRWRDILRLRPVRGAVICLAVAAPWYIYMHMRYPASADGSQAGFLYEFLVRQHLGRATGSEFQHSRFMPGMLAGLFLAGLMPWTIFLPGACLRLGRQGWRERCQRPALVLLLGWTVLVVGLFSVSRTQLPHYILPAFPPMALVLGLYLADRLRPSDESKAFRLGLAATLALGVVTVPALVIGLMYFGLWQAAFWIYAVVMAAMPVLGAVAWARRRHWSALGFVVAGTGVMAMFVLTADPFGIYRTGATYHQIQQIKATAPEAGDAIIAFPHQPYSFAWYLWERPKVFLTPGNGSETEHLRQAHLWDRPVIVLPPLRGEEPTPDDELFLADQLNVPHRTFCVLQKRDMVDKLAPLVRWPIRLLTDKRDRFTMIVTGPQEVGKMHGH